MNMFDFDNERNGGARDAGRAPEWDAARDALAQMAPPDRVEQALLDAFARKHAPLPWYRRWNFEAAASWAGIAALGCAIAIGSAGLLTDLTPQLARVQRVADVGADGFLPLVPPERIAAAINPQLKEADLSREALVQMGIPIVADAPNELVHTELMVAASGEPLAIRLAVN
jgi:hypothetical protein